MAVKECAKFLVLYLSSSRHCIPLVLLIFLPYSCNSCSLYFSIIVVDYCIDLVITHLIYAGIVVDLSMKTFQHFSVVVLVTVEW